MPSPDSAKKPFFTVLPVGGRPPAASERAFLITDRWDDWFKYETLFGLIVYDKEGIRHNVGGVKIGQFGLTPEQRRPEIPREFAALDESFFSVGQDDSYYESLNQIGSALRDRIFESLRDLAANPDLLDEALREDVTRTSLLRSVSAFTVRGQFRRMARGDARLTPYNFTYTAPKWPGSKARPLSLSFAVEPESQPPTNLHVLIGRNGVGKTRILRHMSRALADDKAVGKGVGRFATETDTEKKNLFAGLVSVTFSAFDPFEPLRERKGESGGLRYSYIGLQRPKTREGKPRAPKSPSKLRVEFVESALACRVGAKLPRWRKALEALETDPLFRDAEVTTLAEAKYDGDLAEAAKKLFDRLSSGHKVVLLTTTRLVETVEDRTLVLLDEPEAHLHPPLLSAFVRALSDLLIQRNGVAIIATHSPVVLQEVPRTCAWKLRRSGSVASAERPEIETFGENVGILTREAFGLEVTHSGFHAMLQTAVNSHSDYAAVAERFDEQLGAEARAIVRGLIAARNTDEDDG